MKVVFCFWPWSVISVSKKFILLLILLNPTSLFANPTSSSGLATNSTLSSLLNELSDSEVIDAAKAMVDDGVIPDFWLNPGDVDFDPETDECDMLPTKVTSKHKMQPTSHGHVSCYYFPNPCNGEGEGSCKRITNTNPETRGKGIVYLEIEMTTDADGKKTYDLKKVKTGEDKHIEIEGSDMDLDIEAKKASSVDIKGDNNELDFKTEKGDLGEEVNLSISGDGNKLDAEMAYDGTINLAGADNTATIKADAGTVNVDPTDGGAMTTITDVSYDSKASSKTTYYNSSENQKAILHHEGNVNPKGSPNAGWIINPPKEN